MNERTSKPIIAPKITRPGESLEHKGSRRVTELLPDILQTTVNKQFFDSTLEQLMSSGSLEPIKYFVGNSVSTTTFSPSIDDNYLQDGRDIDPYQLQPGMVAKNNDSTINETLVYDDLIRSLKYNEVATNNHNKVLNETGYTLDIPINYDMFLNYHRYYWVVDVLPVLELAAHAPFTNWNVEELLGETAYTTRALTNGKTLTLENGMRIRFSPTDVARFTQFNSGNTTFTSNVQNAGTVKIYVNNVLTTSGWTYDGPSGVLTFTSAPAVNSEIEIHSYYTSVTTLEHDAIYIVDGVGEPTGITLTKQFEPGQFEGQQGKRTWLNVTTYSAQEPGEFDADTMSFDFRGFDLREHRMTTRDYSVEQRQSQDKSAWSRSNLWVHESTIQTVLTHLDITNDVYTLEKYKATRPIIEFKANIEKSDFGKTHIVNVEHSLESTNDPGIEIVGQTSYSVMLNGFTTEWFSAKGYDRGDKVKLTRGQAPNQIITYYECVQAHGDPADPSLGSNADLWERVIPIEVEDEDLIIFFGSSNATYNNKIWKIGGVGTSITLTETYNFDGSNSATQINNDDKIVVLNGFNTLDTTHLGDISKSNIDAPISGSELYWDGSKWKYGQQKQHRSQSFKANLYDADLEYMDNSTKYPNSDFFGATIFDFVHSETGQFDDPLGFKPEYVDYGNNPGLNFKMDLLTKRFTWIKQSINESKSNQIEIDGYYYYRYLDTDRYHNGWSPIRNGQVVRKQLRKAVTDSTVPLRVDVGHANFVGDRCYSFVKVASASFQQAGSSLSVYSQPEADVNLGRVNLIGGKLPTLFFYHNNTYQINTLFPQAEIEFVNMDGTATSAVSRTAGVGNSFNLSIATPTENSIKYRMVADPTIAGVIYLSNNPSETSVNVRKNGEPFTNYSHTGNVISITSGLKNDDVYDFDFYTDREYASEGEGDHQVASTQFNNPQNKDFGKLSFGDMVEHIRLTLTANPLLTGDWFGVNNYRNIPHVHNFAGAIRQQPYSTELLNQLLVDNNTNPYSALQFNSASYQQFLDKFKLKLVQLHKDMEISQPVWLLVDKALEALHLGKNKSSAFSNSEMLMYRDYKEITHDVSNATNVYNLPEEINTYSDTQNHIQVWLRDVDIAGDYRWRALTAWADYTIEEGTRVKLITGVNYYNQVAQLHVRWYKRGSNSFVPPSAVKLGLIKPFVPELRSDYSKDSTGQTTDRVIIGHDGNVHVRNGTELFNRTLVGFDPIDAGLWDLELRIYNNLHVDLDKTLNQNAYRPNAHRPAVYTWKEYNDTIRSEFNKYKTKNNITELNSDTYYDGSDKFTWNYSSVGPGIGGWRGLYHYYFNTDRPHTHPWEMLGYNKRPTWWDTHYSWTDAPKRAALLLALKHGHVNDPDEPAEYDINYSYINYTWQTSTLVTLTANLNDPVASGIVPNPAIEDRQKDFVFGDWGPVENEWRRTSECKLANSLAFMRTRPLVAMNNYFRTVQRKTNTNAKYDSPQIVNANVNKLTCWKDTDISGSAVIGNIIESVNILNPGSGYSGPPAIDINDNFGINGSIRLFVENGEIISARVMNQGSQYYNKPSITLSNGTGKLEAILSGQATHYYNGLNNSIIDFGKTYGTNADVLSVRLRNTSFQPIIKAGGYVNKNNQFILESSQAKGKVFIPEENVSTLLYTGKPDVEYFFGGIKIDKVDRGYKVSGYDNSLEYFNYNKPNKASNAILVEDAASENIFRYSEYDTNVTKMDYNTVLTTKQDVYDFIQGYGHYLNQQGFTQQWRSSANNFIIWAVGSSDITLKVIPDPSKVTVSDGVDGYFDNIDKKYDGLYNIIDANGNQLPANSLLIDRKSMETDSETVFQVKDADTALYGIRLYKVQLEHIFVLDEITNFDDVVYDQTIAQKHDRIIWRGSRTKDWNGKLYSPGYIVNDNTVIPNYDTVAREVDQYYGRTNTLSNKQTSDIARFNIGYNKPTWSENLDLDDDTLFEFTKGSYNYKGTQHALKAFMRNQELFDGEASAELLEQWAIRTADFGDLRRRDNLEFQIPKDLLTTNPQPVRFTTGYKHDVLSDLIIDIGSTSPLLIHDSEDNQFVTRDVNTYKKTADERYSNDLTTAGLPLLTETDYRVINKDDFEVFPDEVKIVYDHSGDWRDINQWDPKLSYKFNDQVLYKGKTWTMLDPDGSSGLTTANNPIEIHGEIVLPVVPSSGQTLIVDGNTITLNKSATSETLNAITVTATNDIKSSNVVADGSTLILGQTSATTTSVIFNNSVTTTTFKDIEKIGNVINPTITGDPSATLIIDGQTVTFADSGTPVTNNITSQQAFENAFNTSWIQNQSTISSTATIRCTRIEALRSAYITQFSQSAWNSWIQTYFANNAGINISHLVALVTLGGSTQTAAQFMLDQDLTLINNIRGTSYLGTTVGDGSVVVSPADITATQGALNNGTYTADIAVYLQTSLGTTTAFTNTTVVKQITTTGLLTYALSDIVQEINDAGIPNVTASATSSSQLKLTKTTNDPSSSFTLQISVGTQNANVGFSTAVETKTSGSESITSTPPLTQQQVIDQINQAGISGISAQAGANNNNLLQINCVLSSLFIGSGTANSAIGMPTGLVPATKTVTTSTVGLNLTDIVEKANAANISGVTFTNQQNKLYITSINSILTIGAGTANATIGLTAQTFSATQSGISNVFNAIAGSDGNPMFRDVTNDPNVFNIWVADDSEFGSFNKGYEVYQTMDFGMYTDDICSGIESADEAQIDIVRQSGDIQAHNFVVGDYVLIRGSDSVPSIDGIHQVTKVDTNNQARFYIDEFIETNGSVGNIYPLRKMRFGTYAELEADRQTRLLKGVEDPNGVYKYNFADVRQTNALNSIYAFVDDDGTETSAVYAWEGSWNDTNGHIGQWKQVRTGIRQARNDIVANVKIYDAEKQTTLTNIEVFDPAKGIIFGFVDNEIDYKNNTDLANYNFNTLDGAVENVNSWGRDFLGKRWWNTSTAVYLDYEQSTIDYQQNNWGKLFDGASIDIYEWTASPVLPEQWENIVIAKTIIDGQEASGEALSNVINGQTIYNWTEESYYNERKKQFTISG